MSLLTILQKGVKTADKIVKSLEPTVMYQKYVPRGDAYTRPTYPYPPVPLRAIVEWKEVTLPSGSGTITATRPTVLFLDVAELMAATQGAGIQSEDKITLPDGTTGPIQMLDGFMDASTGKTIYTQVALG